MFSQLAADLGLDEEGNAPFRKDVFFASPISKQRAFPRRDSFPHSPFKTLKSPSSFFGTKQNEDIYNEEEDNEPAHYKNHILKYFEQPEDCYTVGQIFSENDLAPAHIKKEPLQETGSRNIGNEQSYNKFLDDSGFKSNASKKLMTLAYLRKDDDGGARCSRGLKVLSVKVRDIVYQKRQTSYKEVAEALINDGSFEASFPGGTVGENDPEE